MGDQRGAIGGAGSGRDDEQSADDVREPDALVQDDRPGDGREGRLERHQGGEGGLRQPS